MKILCIMCIFTLKATSQCHLITLLSPPQIMQHQKFPKLSSLFQKHANYPGLVNYLSHVDFTLCDQHSDIDSIWLFIKTSITKGMDLFIPKIRFSSSWHFPSGIATYNIRHQIKCIWTLRKKYKSHPTDHNFNCFKTAEDKLKNCIQRPKPISKQI